MGVPLTQSVFIALINAPLASARSSPWPRWPASFYSHMVIKWRRKWSSSPHTCMKTSKAAKNRKDLTPLQLKLNFPFCTPFQFFSFLRHIVLKNLARTCELWAGIYSASGPLRLDTTHFRHYLRPLTLLSLSASQDHPVPEAAEDQGAAAESDRGLWPADGHVLHGERGTKGKFWHIISNLVSISTRVSV